MCLLAEVFPLVDCALWHSLQADVSMSLSSEGTVFDMAYGGGMSSVMHQILQSHISVSK